MLLSELLRTLYSVRDNLTSCDIPVFINGKSVEFYGLSWSDCDDISIRLWFKFRQVEDHKSETKDS